MLVNLFSSKHEKNMATSAGKIAVRQVKPLLSVDKGEARRRVVTLYKAWYRQIPYIRKFFPTRCWESKNYDLFTYRLLDSSYGLRCS